MSENQVVTLEINILFYLAELLQDLVQMPAVSGVG
jgi:hypothetical protein